MSALVPTFTVLAQPHPLRPARDAFSLGAVCSVEDAICESAYRMDVSLVLMADTIVVIGDQVIAKEAWRTTYPAPGEQVVLRGALNGPLVALIPVIAGAAATAGATALGFAAGSLAAVAISFAGTLVGMALQMALTPTPRQSSQGGRGDAVSPTYSIQGVRNEARPYGVLPKVFGRVVSYYPPLGCQPYTEMSWGDEQYLRIVFVVNDGPCNVADLKIGDTPLTDFEGVTYRVRNAQGSDPDLTLFPDTVRESALNIELKRANGWSQRRTELSTDEAAVDVVFPNGLQNVTGRGRKYQLQVQFEVQYKPATSAVWLQADLSQDRSTVLFDGGGKFTIRANSRQAIRRSVRIEFPERGQYDIRMRRVTIDDQSDDEGEDQTVTFEQSVWTAIRSFRNDPPFEATGLATIELRIRATDQLNGVIEQFNCTVEALLPVWNGFSWSDQVTRSPAWAYCEVLRGSSNARPIDDSRIDLDAMLAWDASADALGLTFDGVFFDQSSVYERLQDIAATANASVAMPSGQYSVVVDEARSTVIQHFTPRNSWNFSGLKMFARRPHALKVRFPSEATRGQWAERYVYDEGYSASNASIFEVLDLPYTTSARAAMMRARRQIWATRLRPEIYSIEVDAEHLVCTPGDLVRVTHDVPLWGVGAARVLSLTTSGANTTGIVLDAPLPMEAMHSYSFRFRLANGDSLVVAVTTVAGETDTFSFAAPVETAAGPQVGDLAMFGETGSESVQLLVRSIEPRDDLSALMTLVDYAPEIYDADAGDIPEFDPQITLPPVVNRAAPATPVITSIVSDEGVLIRAADGSLTSRIVVGVRLDQTLGDTPAEIIQARYRETGSTDDYQWHSAPASASAISLLPVEDEASYDIQLRSVSSAGVTSAWVGQAHTVVGKTSRPPAVERFYRAGDAVTWPYPNPPPDLAGFRLRATFGTTRDWGQGLALHQGLITAPPFGIDQLHGTRTIMIKAVDTSGLESEAIATITIDLGDVPVANVIDTQSEAPGFTGTIDGGTVSGGVLQANLLSSPLFWRDDTALFWPADGSDPFWPSNVYEEMSYIATWTPASDQLDDGILLIDATITGDYTLDYRISTSPLFWGSGGSTFWGSDTALFWASETVGEWTPWPGKLGPFDTTADSYQVRTTVLGGPVQGVITALDLICDVPDIVERFDDIAIAATTGTRLTLTQTYRAIDNIVITRQDDGGTGVRAEWVDKQANPGAAGGPLIKVRNSAGTVVDGVVDVIVKGH